MASSWWPTAWIRRASQRGQCSRAHSASLYPTACLERRNYAPVASAVRNQCAADPRRDHVWLAHDVGCREPQDAKAGVDDQVLAAIVFDESVPMVRAVVLDDEHGLRVIEVGPAHEPAVDIVQIGLDFRMR